MIYETVITTMNPDGSVHIAPMGIRDEDGKYLIAPFKPSRTLDNLLHSGVAVINTTDDVLIFAGCLTGRNDWPVVDATHIACKRLSAALAHVEVRVESRKDDELRPVFTCRQTHAATHGPFRGFNRAQAAVIEAAILVSRLHLLPEHKIRSELEYLGIAVGKTAGENERTAWQWLTDKVEQYYADNSSNADKR